MIGIGGTTLRGGGVERERSSESRSVDGDRGRGRESGSGSKGQGSGRGCSEVTQRVPGHMAVAERERLEGG